MRTPATGRRSRLLSTSLTAGTDAVPRIVSGEGAWYELEDGRRVIDGSNTAAPLGHAHPEVVEAVRRAASAPALNEGWGWREPKEAAEELIVTAFGDEPWIGAVRFFVSASEANDVALALCQALSGRSALATRERAYHGGAGLAREMTRQPHWHGGLSSANGDVSPATSLAEVHELPAPASARITGQPDPTAGDDWLALIATSGEQTSLFLAPPLVISEPDLHELVDALDAGLAVADEDLERAAG